MNNLYKIKPLSWDILTTGERMLQEYRCYMPALGITCCILGIHDKEFNVTVIHDDVIIGKESTFPTLEGAKDAALQLYLRVIKTMLEEVLDDN